MKKSTKRNNDSNYKPMKKDTLIIIGNGFDRWQGLDTSYNAFQKYYLLHRDEILKKLRIEKMGIRRINGIIEEFSDVELIYGDPFHPDELDEIFWGSFESSLSEVDDERLNLFFGKEKSDLKEMKRSIKNAKKILATAFCDWVASFKIDEQEPKYKFGDNCIMINFNYTDTLVKRFDILKNNEYHIHGEASDRKSIIFGHSSHPEYPMTQLYKFGGRFRGAFFVDSLLYETDKHVQDNIQHLAMFLALHTVFCEDIKDIYVLGHSMSPVDIEYFQFFINATSVNSPAENFANDHTIDDPMEDFMSQMEYVLSHSERTFKGVEAKEKQINAVEKEFIAEQEERNSMMQKMFLKMIGARGKTKELHLPDTNVQKRSENAHWHISCHKPKDKKWVDMVMKELGCNSYTTYETIDECIADFKIN